MANYPILISNRYKSPEAYKLAVAEKAGAYKAARKALTSMTPDVIKAEVKAANIRGRGGAGFPAGMKWGFLNPKPGQDVYLVINADEGEPGTFKDRTLMEKDPHRLIEGCIISMYAIGAHRCWIYVRCELVLAIQRLEAAIKDCHAKGYLGKRPFGKEHELQIFVHPGAGAYICGEETSLLNSLEGHARRAAPQAAVSRSEGRLRDAHHREQRRDHRLGARHVVELGGERWSSLSRLPEMKDGGTRLYGISGHVKRPGVYEAPVGITLRELIYDLGGGCCTRIAPIKGVIPGGSSTPVLRPERQGPRARPQAPDAQVARQVAPRRPDGRRHDARDRHDARHLLRDRDGHLGVHGRGLAEPDALLPPRVLRPVHPLSRGDGLAGERARSALRRAGQGERRGPLGRHLQQHDGQHHLCSGRRTAMPMLAFVRKYRAEFLAAAADGLPATARLDEAVRTALLSASAGGAA
jgi:NADH:ubiquinone oxidoreductase subunit F (NADH-binding)